VGETVWGGDGRCDEGEGEKVGMEGIDSVHLLSCFRVGGNSNYDCWGGCEYFFRRDVDGFGELRGHYVCSRR
jgi:hypothetical protein